MGAPKLAGQARSSKRTARGQKSDRVQNKQHPRPEQQKSKRALPPAKTKNKRQVYTAEELGVPKLNGITPAGVQKAKGKKKGKVFVDDPESMMMILAMVNADKEGQIESKMVKARQMEEIREARRQEAERKQQSKQATVDALKESMKRKRKPKSEASKPSPSHGSASLLRTKSVSFA